MKIRLHSDLHLEGFLGKQIKDLCNSYIPPEETDKDSVLVLAGDISSKRYQLLEFLQEITPRFSDVLYVPGNHEYYHSDYHEWNAWATANLTFVKTPVNEILSYEKDNVRFIMTTLWGDGGKTPANWVDVDRGLCDFRVIHRGDERFDVKHMISVHQNHRANLEDLLTIPFAGKTVVVTHHLPSRHLVAKRFWAPGGGDGINGGFVGACDNILAGDNAPDYWLFGHTHDALDTMLWETRCVSNPTGYYSEYSLPTTGGQLKILEI